jgi:hypothetical protein
MSQHRFLRVFAFREIRMQGISLLFGIPGCRNAENVPTPILSGFHVSRNLGARDISAPWKSRLPKYRNVLGVRSFRFHDSGNRDARVPLLCLSNSRLPKYRNALALILSGFVIRGIMMQGSRSSVFRIPGCQNTEMFGAHSFGISRFGESRCKDPAPLSFGFPVAEIPKCQNAENSRRLINGSQCPPALRSDLFPTTDLLATPLDPTARGISRLSSRVLHRPFRSSRSSLLDLHSVKVCAPTSNRTVCGILHRDPTLDDVLPPELLLTSDLEDFLSLRRLGLRSFQGMSSWISITLSEALSLLSFALCRPRIPMHSLHLRDSDSSDPRGFSQRDSS